MRIRDGFTLIELLVVLAIISVLAAMVAPSLFQNVGDANVTAARSQIESLALALDAYRLDNGRYPDSQQGLAALRAPPTSGDIAANWRGPYLRRLVPLDPWRRPYVYRMPGRNRADEFELYTLGRDGQVGGSGEDADITASGEPVPP